ncbi:MAG: hypothetical protein Q8O24_08195 [Gallionellaceae bacterium]|nr:hypothetical protein [Gallionellaceae bacterium]
MTAFLLFPVSAFSEGSGWGVGGYAGQYYDTEPAGFTQGKASYLNHYMVAITASKTIWRADAIPLSLEIDGMIGQQFGIASITEVAFAPVLRWGWFPWNDLLHTDFRAGPLGVSYTTAISPLERGPSGDGSRLLNFLMLELDFSLPNERSKEVFMRLHHRCSIYGLLNNYGANGEDFLVFGYRRHF